MTLLEISSIIEDNSDMHMARLLILIGTFSGRNGTQTINGLTKLAKLDFLLRYPVYLERALHEKNIDITKVEVHPFERQNIESTMVRYKYGPWDFRYRKFVNAMIGKGLITVHIERKTIKIGITQKGFDTFSQLSEIEHFRDIAQRAKVLKQNFNYSATELMKFIYATFPEISTLGFGEAIEYEY